jgi:hypothetical protein
LGSAVPVVPRPLASNYRPALTSGDGSNCDFHSSNNGDAVTDDSDNDTASKCEDRVRELEAALKTLTAKLSNPTERMMLAGALAHNEKLRPMRSVVTASETKKIFLAMIGALNEPND